MEIIISIIAVLVGVTSLWQGHRTRGATQQQLTHAQEQIRIAREQLRLAELQHALAKPGSGDFGLDAAHINIDTTILGMYEGHSDDNKPTKAGFRPVERGKHVEQFTVAQRGQKLTIVGSSFYPATGEQASHWNGALWELDDDGTLIFGLKVTHRGKPEFGTLTMTFHDHVAEGYYYSGDPGNRFVNSIRAKKVDRFSAVPIEGADSSAVLLHELPG